MAKISTYTTKTDPVGDDKILISDSGDGDNTKQVKISSLPSSGGGSGTVTSVAALTLGTSGTNLTSTVANGSTAAVITLNVPDASGSARGALTSTDWTTFNNKLSTVDLTSNVTGILPIANGGTGASSLPSTITNSTTNYASDGTGTLPVDHGGTGISSIGAYAVFVGTGATTLTRSNSSTGAIQLPSGTTAQRPTPVNGMIRFNSTTSTVEVVIEGSWTTVSTS